ncbi:MAG TPA: serine hydrolase domain-containing protein [Kofleriaceae bacterium]|nr:serine hydrolase domain-containing protein [Kofleriaceae bacterium]
MRRRTFLHATAAAVGASACGHSSPPLAAPAAAGPDLASWLPVLKTPGLAAKGSLSGRSLVHVAGVRAAGRGDPITPTTVFSAASLTKPVFTMVVRQLARSGRLDWRRPLQDYLSLGLTGPAAKITTEHVLSHATGLVNWRFDPAATLESQFEPGTRWKYSGEGYVLLQRVVEHLVGAPLGRHLNTVVLPSLGMTESTFTWTPAVEPRSATEHDEQGQLLERSATYYAKQGYAVAEKAGVPPESLTYDQFMATATREKLFAMPVGVTPNAAASLWTTIGDYQAFLERSMADAAAHPDEYAIHNRIEGTIGWALSWGVDTSLGAPAYFHWGDSPGVKNFTWWQPATKTSIAIFTNSDHGASAYRYALRHLLGIDPIAPEWV